MSKGTPIVPIRVNPILLRAMDAEIAKINKCWKVIPYNRTTFILSAIRERIKHLERSRKKRPKAKNILDNPQSVGVPLEHADESQPGENGP